MHPIDVVSLEDDFYNKKAVSLMTNPFFLCHHLIRQGGRVVRALDFNAVTQVQIPLSLSGH